MLPYVESLKKELEAQDFADGKVRVMIDDRDIRGGEKNWYHVKRGVPLRAEIGPKDIAKNGVFLARRDTGEKAGVDRARVRRHDRPAADRDSGQPVPAGAEAARGQHADDRHARRLPRLLHAQERASKPEIHGGFALCHFAEGPELDELLKKHKVTIRCIPLERGRRAGQVHLHRQAEHEAGGVCEGVLRTLTRSVSEGVAVSSYNPSLTLRVSV